MSGNQIRRQAVRRRHHVAERRAEKMSEGWKTTPRTELIRHDLRFQEVSRVGKVVGASFCTK